MPHTSRAALRPGTAAVVKNISRPGLCFCESSGFRGYPWVLKSWSSQDGVNARMVPSGGVGKNDQHRRHWPESLGSSDCPIVFARW